MCNYAEINSKYSNIGELTRLPMKVYIIELTGMIYTLTTSSSRYHTLFLNMRGKSECVLQGETSHS